MEADRLHAAARWVIIFSTWRPRRDGGWSVGPAEVGGPPTGVKNEAGAARTLHT